MKLKKCLLTYNGENNVSGLLTFEWFALIAEKTTFDRSLPFGLLVYKMYSFVFDNEQVIGFTHSQGRLTAVLSLLWETQGQSDSVQVQVSRDMTKPTKWVCTHAKTHIWSESSLYAQWVAKDPCFLHADSLRWTHTPFVGFVMSWLKWWFSWISLILLSPKILF